MASEKIRHMVIFNLKHSKDSPEEKIFLQDAEKILTSIPVVKNFKMEQQISSKSDYDFGLYMEFDSDQDYEIYDTHPTHIEFVEQRWRKEVENRLVIDFKAI